VSLRRRLVGAVTAVTLLTMGGAFTAVSVVVNGAQERQLDRALLGQAGEEAADVARRGVEAIDERPGPRANNVGPLPKYGAVYSAAGATLAATASLRGSAPAPAAVRHPPRAAFDLWHGRHHVRAVVVPVPDGSGRVLFLAASRADLDGDERFLRRALTIVFVVAVAWTILVATWFVRRLTRDHEVITRVVRRVAAGDLSARVASRSDDRELAQVGGDIDEMIARLEVLVAAQQRFIAHAAHELRSPLTTMLGELSLALRRARDADAYRAAIEEALGATRRLNQLADDLLSLARLGAGEPRPAAAVAVAEAVRAAEAEVSARAAEREVAVAVGAVPGSVRTRARDLQRLLRNLLDNAIRHTPRGGAVRVRSVELADAVLVRVADDGPGVPAEERERIFEPFYRVATDAADEGSGLGLSIVREIARAYGGEVMLAPDAPDATGACFVVRLPRAEG
jgi:two-component system heavy metal sensor histidine kinase CusS